MNYQLQRLCHAFRHPTHPPIFAFDRHLTLLVVEMYANKTKSYHGWFTVTFNMADSLVTAYLGMDLCL